jgi:hypothetical protein
MNSKLILCLALVLNGSFILSDANETNIIASTNSSTAKIVNPQGRVDLLQPSRENSYEVVTNAINHGDWVTLRSLAKPGMRANEYITMWENSERSGHALRVGKQIAVNTDADLNGKRCTKYSFIFENKDGTFTPHELQILVEEHSGQSEVLDFWNFGW